jgi:cellulose-binding protein
VLASVWLLVLALASACRRHDGSRARRHELPHPVSALQHRLRTEGLICASSGFHWKGEGTGRAPGERFIDKAAETYEQVYPNLRVHDRRYPTPAELKSKIRWGNVEFDGDCSVFSYY